MIDLFKINHLIKFYIDQYGLVIRVSYKPYDNYLSCTIKDNETNLVMSRCMNVEYMHGDGTERINGMILDFLAKRAEVCKNG